MKLGLFALTLLCVGAYVLLRSKEPRAEYRSPDASRTEADRHARISDAAYFLAERRGFASGHELDDWLAAEREDDQLGYSMRLNRGWCVMT